MRNEQGLPGTRNLLCKLATPLDPDRISTTLPLGTQCSSLLSTLLSSVVSCCLLCNQTHRLLLSKLTRLNSFKHACHEDRRHALRLACSRRLCLKSCLTATLRDADTGCWLGFARRVYSTLSVTRRTGALIAEILKKVARFLCVPAVVNRSLFLSPVNLVSVLRVAICTTCRDYLLYQMSYLTFRITISLSPSMSACVDIF